MCFKIKGNNGDINLKPSSPRNSDEAEKKLVKYIVLTLKIISVAAYA